MRTLYRNAVVYTPAVPHATALLVEGSRIAWLGGDTDAPYADRIVDAEGAVITPGFVDAHVHGTDTGLSLMRLNLAGVRSAQDLLDRVHRYAMGLASDAIVVGYGWDECGWPQGRVPTPEELDRAAHGRQVYLLRIDGHSALVSTALIAAALGCDHRDGWLRQEEHHAVRAVVMASIRSSQRAVAQETMLRHAASLGIVAVHECGGPHISCEDDFTHMLKLSKTGEFPEVFGLWGEVDAADKARELGAWGAAGDIFVDGTLGSRTAYLREPYRDGDGCGCCYLTVAQITGHVVACIQVGIQAGFHAIGDGALARVIEGFTEAARVVGKNRLRAGRHRIEHAEMVDRAMIAAMVDLGLSASVQPSFDVMWGGDEGMYAARLGVERAGGMNPFAAIAGVGGFLMFGSDSPVTCLDPWGAVRAAACHHNALFRMGVKAGFAAHTRGGWRAVHHDDEGVLLPGSSATFAVWHAPEGIHQGLPVLVPLESQESVPLTPVCRRTVVRGVTIFDGGLVSVDTRTRRIDTRSDESATPASG